MLYLKDSKLKSPVKKTEVHLQYKCYINILSKLVKEKNCYGRFFKNNLNNIRNIWKGIRSLIAIKHSSESNIHLVKPKVAIVTVSLHVANIFMTILVQLQKK